MSIQRTSFVVTVVLGAILAARPVLAHCDTADASVAAGREFVEAYVEFTHHVERLHLDATTSVSHHAGSPAGEHKH